VWVQQPGKDSQVAGLEQGHISGEKAGRESESERQSAYIRKTLFRVP
jgi:hypothetical protein